MAQATNCVRVCVHVRCCHLVTQNAYVTTVTCKHSQEETLHPVTLNSDLDLKRDLTSGGSTLGPGAAPPPKKIVAEPPNLAVFLTHCGHLIVRKISKLYAPNVTF